jgi:hypothetical protein
MAIAANLLALCAACSPQLDPVVRRQIEQQRESLGRQPRSFLTEQSEQVDELNKRGVYLCCNMWFDSDGEASDANYMYMGGRFLPVGTKVQLLSMARRSATFTTAEGDKGFRLSFDFGEARMSSDNYFKLILRERNPLESIGPDREPVRPFIEGGKVVLKMNREEVIMARGYPPFHTTTGIEADQWIYYQSRGLVRRVQFHDGVVVSIEDGMPP